MPVDDYGPAPADSPLSYPGQQPVESFVYRSGELWGLGEHPQFDVISDFLAANDEMDLTSRVAVLCLGSNASPPQIRKKMADMEAAGSSVFLRCWASGMKVVYAGHVAKYGAIPATADAGPEIEELFVALYTPEQLQGIGRSEHGNYSFCRLPGVSLTVLPEVQIVAPYAFLSRKGVLVGRDGSVVPLGSSSQAEVLRSVLDSTGLGATLTLAEYIANADALRDELDEAIGRTRLRRPTTLDHEVLDVTRAEAVGSLA